VVTIRDKSSWTVFLTIAIIGTITWLAIFEHNYHRGETTRFMKICGKVTGSMSRNMNYLIVGENPAGSEYNRAQELGIAMVDESELKRMAEG